MERWYKYHATPNGALFSANIKRSRNGTAFRKCSRSAGNGHFFTTIEVPKKLEELIKQLRDEVSVATQNAARQEFVMRFGLYQLSEMGSGIWSDYIEPLLKLSRMLSSKEKAKDAKEEGK